MPIAGVVPPLVGSLIRAISWVPLLVVTPLVPALAGLYTLADDRLPPEAALVLLRAAGLLLGAAAAFVLADEMAGSTGAVPSPRWLRQWLRTGLALGYAAAAWAAAYALIAAGFALAPPPLPGAAVEAAVCVTVGLAGAAHTVRRVPERYAATAGSAMLFALLVPSLFLPAGWSPWVVAGAPQWDRIHIGWLLAVPVAMAALAFAHRDTR